MTRKEAFEGLCFDVLENPIYEYFDAIKEAHEYPNDTIKYVANDDSDNVNEWENILKNIISYLTAYQNLRKGDRLTFSDILVPCANKKALRGIFEITNGLNGKTQVSRQSLQHVMDIITYLEDYYGARAYISYVHYHSDIFYYGISFVIWKDFLEKSKKEKDYANLKPLYHMSYDEK